MYKILTLNNIAVAGLRHLPRERYEVASEIAHPDSSFKAVFAHSFPISNFSCYFTVTKQYRKNMSEKRKYKNINGSYSKAT